MNHQAHLGRAAACLLLALAGTHVHAQQAMQAAADPQAAAPATRYQPVLGARPEAAPAASPAQNWVAANQTVAATNSMALTMKGMDGHAQHAGHDHAAMQAMPADKKDAGGMCMPGGGDKGGQGKMACCQNGCGSGAMSGCCCKDMMKKDKEAP